MLDPSMNRNLLSSRARLLAILAALCLLVPLAALRLPAQSLSGKFSGTIYDPGGARIPNATVIMTNHKTNEIEMTTSDGEGSFGFMDLAAGEYEMKVLKPGFAEYDAPEIVLDPDQESSQNITLNVGSVTEEVNVVAQGTAMPLAGQRTEKPARVRVGGMIQAPKLLKKVQPVYPEAAKAAGVQGSVILRAVIGIEGTPQSLRVMNSQVDPELARAALEAVSKWRYSPTLLNGEPVEVDTTITVKFTLSSPSIGMPTREGKENPQESIAMPPAEQVCVSEVMIAVPPSFGPSQIEKARQKAELVRTSAQTGTPFAELAKANSKGPTAAQGGSIGCFRRGQLAKVLEERIFGMHVGEVSDVLTTKQGFVVLQVTKHTTL